VIGTPGNFTKSFWAQLTRGCKAGTLGDPQLREPGWSAHTWRWEANPYTRDQVAEQIARMTAENPLIVETAGYRQNYEGEWVIDTDELVYKFNAERNTFTTLPVYERGEWTYVLAIDLGYTDPTAFTLLAFHPLDPVLYILESWKKSGLDITAVAHQIKGYAPLRILGYQQRFRIQEIVIDNSNAQAVAELAMRHGLSLTPAERQGKADFQELMSDDLVQGRIKVHPEKCAALVDEWQSLIWDPNSDRHEEHPDLPNHCADAALYGWRATYAFLAKVPVPPPPPGTKEHEEMIRKKLFEHAQREVQRAKSADPEDALDAYMGGDSFGVDDLSSDAGLDWTGGT